MEEIRLNHVAVPTPGNTWDVEAYMRATTSLYTGAKIYGKGEGLTSTVWDNILLECHIGVLYCHIEWHILKSGVWPSGLHGK